MNNKEIFADTQRRIRDNSKLNRNTHDAILHTRIYNENFFSNKKPHYQNSNIYFREALSLIPAREYSLAGKKTAVLNFANPVELEGGVLRGATTQEEIYAEQVIYVIA